MTEQSPEAARIDRMFLIVFVPVAIFMLVGLYVRITTDTDPLWTELGTPLFFALLGVRSMAVPAAPAERKMRRNMGILLIVCAALILFLNLLDHFQGAS
jgi:hypothetical protein